MNSIIFLQKWIFLINFIVQMTKCAILPPPWADPNLNPCASQPRGWQLLYWPPDGKCYKIFQIGYPCPEGMELSPKILKPNDKILSAECRCPINTAQSTSDGQCYELYTLGPCDKGYFFAPDIEFNKNTTNSKKIWGTCQQMASCNESSLVYWPRNRRCYRKYTRGPCSKGQLLVVNKDKIPECKCDKNKEFQDYRHSDGHCYQHFTRGPCREKGHLFLPDRSCGCYSFLPHYHEDTKKCFELGTIGPCNPGEYFQVHPEIRRGICQCKPEYIRFNNSSSCYRPFTQGPCENDFILSDSSQCIRQPCTKGHLYFSSESKCHRIGSQGPCKDGQVVTFDFRTRPSIDGLSYNGICIEDKRHNNGTRLLCDKSKGLITFKNKCYKLYSSDPCPRGSWLVPLRQGKEIFDDGNGILGSELEGVCECKPNFARVRRTLKGRNVTYCMPPTVILADYLNNKNYSFVDSVP